MSPISPKPAANDELADAILREGPWIRRLAGALLGDAASADDLSQDVVAEALVRRPAVETSRLRAWLRTVARRIASRKRERDRARDLVERRAARPEAIEQNAHDRLRLYRELAAAIDRLEPPYRTALVLRYLEGLPPREIATRIDTSVMAARKRVSRGLAMLRETLDAEHGGVRENWSIGIASLLFPKSGAAPLESPGTQFVAASSPFAIPWIAGMTMKTLLCALAAVAVGVLIVVRPFGASSVVAPRQEAGVTLSTLDSTRSTEPTAARETDGEDTRRMPVSAPVPSRAARVHVVDVDGGVVKGIVVAWVGVGGDLHELKIDGGTSVERPADSNDARFFACAPGYDDTFVHAGPVNEDVDITLAKSRVLRGRIVEDGGPPERSLRVRADEYGRVQRLSPREQLRLAGQLEALGVIRSKPEAWTRPDGSFELEGLEPKGTGWLQLPRTHQPIVDGVPVSRIAFDADDREFVLETVLLPSVVGRLVWEDDGTPAVGSLHIRLKYRVSGIDMDTGARTDQQGNFAIGLQIDLRALHGPREERAGARVHSSLSILAADVNGASAPFQRRVELAGADFSIDLGVVRVPRAKFVSVLVIGPDGEAIEDATLVSSIDAAKSDAEGRARLACANEDELAVLACGYSYRAIPVVLEAATRSPFEIRLERGCTLAVRLNSSERTESAIGLSIQITWEESPFEGAHIHGAPPFSPMPDRVHSAFHGESVLYGARWNTGRVGSPGSLTYTPLEDGDFVVPGLRAGSSFVLRATDDTGHALVESSVVMPTTAGTHLIDLSNGLDLPCRLRVRIIDELGEPIAENGSLGVQHEDAQRAEFFQFTNGSVDTGPVAAGTFSLTTHFSGYAPRRVESYSLTHDSPVLELELERTRRLDVFFVDEKGRPLVAESVRIEAEDGWSQSSGVEGGKASFLTVPRRPLKLFAAIGTRTYYESIDALQVGATITLPAHGRLAIRLASPPRLEGTFGAIRARICELDTDASTELTHGYFETVTDPITIETDLLAGRYRVEVDLVERPEDALEDDEPLVRHLDQRVIAVEAGEAAIFDVAQ